MSAGACPTVGWFWRPQPGVRILVAPVLGETCSVAWATEAFVTPSVTLVSGSRFPSSHKDNVSGPGPARPSLASS